ncbi:MAG: trypsin-like peptidase domain-containing protein [Bdellovibrionia bacterium]
MAKKNGIPWISHACCRTIFSLLGASVLGLPGSPLPSFAAFPPPETPSFRPKKRATPNPLQTISQAMREVVRKASPAVFGIRVLKPAHLEPETPDLTTPHEPSETPQTNEPTVGIGTGIWVRSDGMILTNYHVIEGALTLSVQIDETKKVPAHVVGVDPATDLAVIQVNQLPERKISPLPFGDSRQVQVGDGVLAIGNPFGLSRSVSSGIISAVGRKHLGQLELEDLLQTDAAINPGNSGGPLLNARGEIIGITTAIFSQSGGSIGVGFAIPAQTAQKVFEEILQHHRVIRGWAGLVAQDLNEDLARFFQFPSKKGALISKMDPEGPAAHCGLKVGDIVLRLGHTPIQNAEDFKTRVRQTSPPAQLPLTVFRKGVEKTLQFKIQEHPEAPPSSALLPFWARALSPSHSETDRTHPLGLSLENLPEPLFKLFGIPSAGGALIAHVQVGSSAEQAGFTRGDIVLSLNDHPIQNAQELITQLNQLKPNEAHILYIRRGPQENLFLSLRKRPQA